MSYGKLREELINDPLGRGYMVMSDAAVLTDLTDESLRPLPDLNELSGSAIYEVIDRSEYQALSAAEKDELKVILTLGDSIQVGPASKARAALAGMFGPATTTRAALLGLVTNRTQSRAQELNLPSLDVDLIAAARS